MYNEGMTKETAQLLKDGGFPQWRHHDLEWRGGKLKNIDFSSREWDGVPYSPDLSELIEACGLKFYSLTNNLDGKWTVTHDDRREHAGSTPEEAVARLWLELQK